MHGERVSRRLTRPRRGRAKRLILSAAAASAMVAALPLRANNVYTSTNVTGFWSNSGEWVSNVVPVSGIDTELDFGGSGGGANTFTDDIGTGTFTLNEVQLNSTATTSQTIAGNTTANTLTFAANSLSAGPQILQNNSGAYTISNGIVLQNMVTLGGSGTGSLTLNGPISGAAGLMLNGGYTVTLAGPSTFTGNIAVSGGTLRASLANNSATPTFSALGSPSAAGRTITINAGGQLLFAASNVLGSSAAGGPALRLVINGGAVAASAGTSNILGPITLNGGTLTTNVGGSANYQSFYLAAGNVTVGGSQASTIATAGASNNGIHLAATTLFNVADATGDSRADLTIAAPLLDQPSAAPGGLTKTGAGTLLLTGASTYSGTTVIDGGVLDLNNSTGSISSAADLTFAGTGTFLYENVGATAKHTQLLNAITFSGGDGTVEVDYGPAQQVIALLPDHIGARSVGATGNLVVHGTTDSSKAEIVLLGQPGGFINQATFFNGSNYAWTDPSSNIARGIQYGSDSGAVTSAGGASLLGTYVQTTGAVSSQSSTTFATLNIVGNANFLLASGATLTVNGILKSGNVAGGAILGDGGAVAAGIQAANNAELVIRTDGPNDSLTINTRILANGVNAVTKSGLGTLTFSGTNTYTGVTTVNAGTLAFTSDRSSSGGGGLVVGGTAGTAQLLAGTAGTLTFNLPDIGGVSGAASSPGAAGAIIQSAGTFNYSNGSSGHLQLGTGIQSAGSLGGYGAYTLGAGTLSANGAAAGMRVGSVGLGSYTQTGGNLVLGRDWSIGTWGTGVATLTGGNATGASGFGISVGDLTGSGTLNVGTLAGGNATLLGQSSAGVQLAGGTGTNGLLNLNAGILALSAGTIHKGTGASAVVNWNGGTVQAASGGLTLLDGTLDHVNVFNGNAIVDTQAFTATISAPLTGAAGNGIYPAGGTLSIASGGAGYIGAPLVTVSGGAGTGAAAIANISNGAITGVTLTSPGQNYQPGDVLNFAFAGGGAAAAAPPFSYTLQLADLSVNSVGGLKKLGSGTLILSANNTFLGATSVLSGTLQVDGSLANTPVTIAAGATLAGKGTIANLGANSVTINGTVAPGDALTYATLTTGPMTWGAGGGYTWKVSQLPAGSSSSGAGTNWDNVSFTSLSVLAGGTPGNQFTITPIGNPPGIVSGQTYTWQVAQLAAGGGGAVSGFSPSAFVLNTTQFAANAYPPSDFAVALNGNEIDLVFTAAPEPSSIVMVGIAIGACVLRRRRPSGRVNA